MTGASWDEREARLRRFYAAVHTDRLLSSANAAMRVADEEQAELVARLARVEALHTAFRILADCATDGCDRDDCAEGDEPGIPVHWNDVLYRVCSECRDEDGERIDWPCATARALEVTS